MGIIGKVIPSTNEFPGDVTGLIWYFLVDKNGTGKRKRIGDNQHTDWFYQVKIGPCFEMGHFDAKLDGEYWILSKNIFYSHLQLKERSIGKTRADNPISADKRLRKSVLEYIEAISFETGLTFLRETQTIYQGLRSNVSLKPIKSRGVIA